MPASTFLLEHAGVIITVCRVGPDGKTAYERLKQRKFGGELVEFGECVQYKDEDAGKGLEPRWKDGVWIGLIWGPTKRSLGHQRALSKSTQ